MAAAKPMKILVSNEFWVVEELWVRPSQSISSLRQAIMARFFITEEKMKERLLVHDNRSFRMNPPILLADGCDLFELDGSTTLDACGIKKPYSRLRLGWKGPFLLGITTDSDGVYITKDIEVSCYDTVQIIKPKVVEVTKEPITAENFPQVLLSQEHRTLLSLGYYNFSDEYGEPKQCIFRNSENLITTAKPEYYGDYVPIPGLVFKETETEELNFKYPRSIISDTIRWGTQSSRPLYNVRLLLNPGIYYS